MIKKEVYLIDASIYVFRGYFSMPNEFKSQDNLSVNAVYGFARFLSNFLHQTKAEYVACAFDESLQSSFRNEIYPPYKANREPAPEELKKQFVLCKRLTEAMGVSAFSDSNYEADDLIGTLAQTYKQRDYNIHVVSADKDLAQLIGEGDTWWSYGKSDPFDTNDIFEKFKVYPNQIADFLALTGDSVDNIPGVAGIGPKTASQLLNHFGTLDNILERHQEIAYLSMRGAKSVQTKIANSKQDAILAKQLTNIVLDVPLNDPSVMRKSLNHEKLAQLFDYLQFGPMVRRRILDTEFKV